MASEQPAEESIAENGKEVAPTKERPTRRKQHRPQASHFAWKLRRAGLEAVSLIHLTSAVTYLLDYTNI